MKAAIKQPSGVDADAISRETVRARDLVLRYGWNTTCFQIVNPGIKYWFTEDSVTGYVGSGKVRVVAGAPVCSAESLRSIAAEFEADASRSGETVCYFGAESRLESLYGRSQSHSKILIGAQPFWHPASLAAAIDCTASLRAQCNRARNKGLRVYEISPREASESSALSDCLSAWLGIKGLPPLHFVIEPDTLARLEHRRIFIAERESRIEGFLVLSPIPARRGWLTEQFPHRPQAPNGTVESMIAAAARTLAAGGSEYITLGLSPLSRRAAIPRFDNPLWIKILLAWLRKHGQRFYNFDGLDSFKAKFRPGGWEPVFAISNEPTFSGQTMWAIAKAFTANRPFRVIAGGLSKALRTEAADVFAAAGNIFARYAKSN
jgi:phosphatidylglycerol lysyltransferase